MTSLTGGVCWLGGAGMGVIALDVLQFWSDRVVPSGYASWIFVSRILVGVFANDPAYAAAYSVVASPVPNCVPVAMITTLGPLVIYRLLVDRDWRALIRDETWTMLKFPALSRGRK